MKKGILSIGIVLILLLGLAGCGGGGGTNKRADENYRSGSEGLRVSFVPNLPPFRLYDDQTVDILLEVENRGTHDIGTGGDRVYISGFDQNIISGIQTVSGIPIGRNGQLLEGRDQFNTIGDIDNLEFNQGQVRDLRSRDVDRYTTTLLATACYGYNTIASGNVCIDPDPYETSPRRKVCTPSSIGLGSQGAPVAVTGVDVEGNPRRTIFRIYVANVGGGDVYEGDPTLLTKCSPYDPVGLEFDELDYVTVEDVQVSGQSILGTCRPLQQNGKLRLIGGQGSLVCFLDTTNLGSGSAFMTPIVVELRYGYRSTTSQSIEIVQSLR